MVDDANLGGLLGLINPATSVSTAFSASSRAKNVCEVTNSPGKLYHYTSRKYADSIVENGLKPGAKGKVFTTPDGTMSGLQAQIDLALPPNRGIPDALLELDTKTLQRMGVDVSPSSLVKRDFNMPGGERETVFDSLLPPEAVRRVR